MAGPGQPILLGDFPQQADNQPPSQFGRPFPGPAGAADHNAQVRGRVGVKGGVAGPGGYQQAQLRQAGQYRPGKGRPFPHPHDRLKALEPRHQLVRVGQVVAEYGQFGIRR